MPALEPITLRQFGFGASLTLEWTLPPARKVGEICRLARMYRQRTLRELGVTLGCSISHVMKLAAGRGDSIESYLPLIAALHLNGVRLLPLVRTPVKVSTDEAVTLLLDPATCYDAAAIAEVCADEQIKELVRNVRAVLGDHVSPADKLASICRLTREQKKLRQVDIGERLRCSKMHVSALESGGGNVHDYMKLAHVLGIAAEKLLALITGDPTEEQHVEELLRPAIAPEKIASSTVTNYMRCTERMTQYR